MFCTNCGSPLPAGTPAPSGAPPMYPAPGAYGGAMPGLPSAWDVGRRKQIDRTKTGLLLLLIGGLISWIPIIGLLGGVLLLVGAILVILGRKAFGSTHARNVVLAIVLFFVGIIIGVIAGVLFGVAVFSAVASQNRRPRRARLRAPSAPFSSGRSSRPRSAASRPSCSRMPCRSRPDGCCSGPGTPPI